MIGLVLVLIVLITLIDMYIHQLPKAVIETPIAGVGGLHVLVNNACIVQVGDLHECTDKDWDEAMNTNIRPMFYSTKYAYDDLRNNPRSDIVNVGSINSFVGQASIPVFTTSKHDVHGGSRQATGVLGD